MLRIVSKADTADSFIQIFAHLCDRDSLFIVTRSPKEVGTKTRFSISLKTGEPVISGRGEVIEKYEGKENPYGRAGMKLRFIELDGQSRGFIERLVSIKEAHKAPPAVPPPIPSSPAQAAAARSQGAAVAPAPSAPSAGVEANAASGEQGPSTSGEERLQGSGFILPANPFGELTENVLEAFIECSLYEDTTNSGLDIPGEAEVAQGSSSTGELASQAELPAPAVQGPAHGADASPPRRPMTGHAAAGTESAGVSGHELATGTVAGVGATAQPPAPPARAPSTGHAGATPAPPAAAGPMPAAAPGPAQAVGHPRHASGATTIASGSGRGNWKGIAVASVLAAVSSLGVGYILWGQDANSAGEQAAVSPALSSRDGSPGQEQEPAGEPPAEPGSDSAQTDQGGEDAAAEDEARAEESSDAADSSAPAQAGDADEPTGARECQVRLTSDPEEAVVFTGGEKLGTTPLETALPCGETEFRFARARRRPSVETVELTPDQVNEISVDLERPRVELVVISAPPGARVEINGKPVGKTPVSVDIPGFRRAKVKIKKSGYRTYRKRIYPRRSKNKIRARLRPARRRR